jgi:hypothetical protein
MAAGLTIISNNLYLRAEMEPFKLILDWTGDADVALSKAIADEITTYRKNAGLKAPYPGRIKGSIVRMETVPGANGDRSTYCPAGTYAVTLLGQYGYDVLDGNGAARSISAAETVVFSTPIPVDEDLTLTIASTATADQLAGAGAFTDAGGNVTNWTLGAGWADGTNVVDKSGDGVGTLTHTLAAVAGRKYDITYTISDWSVGTVIAKIGNAAGTSRGANGTYTETVTAINTDVLTFTPTNTSRFTIDAITVKYSDPQGRVILFIE